MKKFFAMAFAVIFIMTFTSCAQTQPDDLINMHSLEQDGKFTVIGRAERIFLSASYQKATAPSR